MDRENFGVDYFGFPQGFGMLACDGNEENITSCSMCEINIEGPIEEGGEIEGLPPPGSQGSDGSIPGSACCRRSNRPIAEETVDITAISCLGKSLSAYLGHYKSFAFCHSWKRQGCVARGGGWEV